MQAGSCTTVFVMFNKTGYHQVAKGKKNKFLGVRIFESTFADLEKSAAARGHSISREVERLLISALGDQNNSSLGPPHIRGLMLLFADVIGDIEARTGETWRTRPFTRLAVATALARLLSELGAPGSVEYPNSTWVPKHAGATADEAAIQLGEWRAHHALQSLALFKRPRRNNFEEEGDYILPSEAILYPQINADLGHGINFRLKLPRSKSKGETNK